MIEEVVRDLSRLDDRISPGVETDAFGEKFGTYPGTVAADRVDDQRELWPLHRPDAGESPAEGERGGCRVARAPLKVEADVALEHPQGGPDEPGHTIGMSAGAPALHQTAQCTEWRRRRCAGPGLDGQRLHRRGQNIEAVDAGAALARP